MGQGNDLIPGSIHRSKNPLGGALLDGVNGITGRRLKDLRKQAIGVACEQPLECCRFLLGVFNSGHGRPQERSAKLDGNHAVRGKVTRADDASDRALAPHKYAFHLTAIYAGDQIGDEAWPAWKIYLSNVVTRPIEQIARLFVLRDQAWGDQAIVLLSQGAQKIVLAVSG